MEVLAGSESVSLWVTVLLDWFVTGLMEGFFCLKELGWRIPDGLFPEVSERVPLFPRKKVFPKFCPKRFYGVFCPCCEVLGCLVGCERTEKRSNSTQVEEHRSAISILDKAEDCRYNNPCKQIGNITKTRGSEVNESSFRRESNCDL